MLDLSFTKFVIKKLQTLPFKVFINKVVTHIKTKTKDAIQRIRDIKFRKNHINFNVPLIKNSYISIKDLDLSGINPKIARYLSQMYCNHRFDLLGSGWVKNSYKSKALGVEEYFYVMNSEHIPFISNDYEPIDWQKDYKSGYRWNENTWYKDHKYGHILGVDVKVPWELARLQHLPQMAVFSLVDSHLLEKNILEFKYQILDFIYNNPPRMGINWVCTMDVAIRATNMLIAYDLFNQLDKSNTLDHKFKQTFVNSIYEHGLHIVNNLEYDPQITSNHYLSNIAGLLFISAYLENDQNTILWLAFSLQEIFNEINKQFYEDGGNFESSTCYHRLSGEMVVYSIALILGLKQDKLEGLLNYNCHQWKNTPKLKPLNKQIYKIFTQEEKIKKVIIPQSIVDKLFKIGRFTYDITKPNNEIPQFGDNDSGRFIKLSPVGKFLDTNVAKSKYINLKNLQMQEEEYWDENVLNHSPLLSCFAGLFNERIFENDIKLEKSIIKSLSNSTILSVSDYSYKPIQLDTNSIKLADLKYNRQIIINLSNINLNSIKLFAYPDSGIYIYKGSNFYLAICATPLGQNGNGGHTHNDKLGFELYNNDLCLVKDPGTYLYTPLPERRNAFRSTKAHFVPIIKEFEQNIWIDGKWGLFNLVKNSECSILSYGSLYLELALTSKNIIIVRRFEINKNNLTINDYSNKDFYYERFPYYSNGYGKLMLSYNEK